MTAASGTRDNRQIAWIEEARSSNCHVRRSKIVKRTTKITEKAVLRKAQLGKIAFVDDSMEEVSPRSRNGETPHKSRRAIAVPK
jgi:hypothetical protein